MTLSELEWDAIFAPVIATVKRMLNLPKCFPTAALLHEGILGLDNPWKCITTEQTDCNIYDATK